MYVKGAGGATGGGGGTGFTFLIGGITSQECTLNKS